MTFEYSPFWFGVLIGIGVVFISLAILFGIKIAYSQDVDPAAYCLYKDTYPFNELCNEQQINNIYKQLLERAREYNNP